MKNSSSQKSLSQLSDLSSFEQWLPQEPASFHVELPERRTFRKSRVQKRSYDFTVDPGTSRAATARSRGKQLVLRSEFDYSGDSVPDERSCHLEERSTFRVERARCFSSGRAFPALVSPRFLPSFQKASRALAREAVRTSPGAEGEITTAAAVPPPPQKVSKLMEPTVSQARKNRPRRSAKANKQAQLPFLPGGRGNSAGKGFGVCDRSPGLFDDDYDAAWQARQDERREAEARFIHGVSWVCPTKPVRALPPLARDEKIQTAEKPWRTPVIRQAPAHPATQPSSGRSAPGAAIVGGDVTAGVVHATLGRTSSENTSRGLDVAVLAQNEQVRAVMRAEFGACVDEQEADTVFRAALAVISEECPGSSGEVGGLATALRQALWHCGAAGALAPSAHHAAGELVAYRGAERRLLHSMLDEELYRPVGRGSNAPLQRISPGGGGPCRISEEPLPRASPAGGVSLRNSVLPPGHGSLVRGSSRNSTSLRRPSGGQAWQRGGIPLIHHQDTIHTLCGQMKVEQQKEAELVQTEQLGIGVFRKLADDGKVHQDDLPRALELLGYVRPDKVWISEVVSQITKYVALDADDFTLFIRGYEACQRKAYKEAFARTDLDGSGTVEAAELSELLRSLGIEPMRHVLDEVIFEVDTDSTGNLDFNEFDQVMGILRERDGFLKNEYEELQVLFDKFDRDKSGTMDVKEVETALVWLGMPLCESARERIIQEVDADASGQIDQAEWFVCMRQVRDTKIEVLRQVMKENDTDGNGTIQYHEICELLRSMGYVPDVQSVREAAADAGIAENDDDLDLSELWRLLKYYREREGLSRREVAEIDDAFKRADINGKGEVGIESIGSVIRSIGYTLSFEVQQSLIAKVDIDGSGKLDLYELRKMIRMIRERDFELFRMAFHEAAGREENKDTWGTDEKVTSRKSADDTYVGMEHAKVAAGLTITARQAQHGLLRVGCVDVDGAVAEVLPEDKVSANCLDFYGFVQAALRSRQQARIAFRENGGFSRSEVAKLRTKFDRYDADGSGQISGRETVTLMEHEFPLISNDARLRPQLTRLLAEADEDGSGSLDFGDFLRVMRHTKDIQDEMMVTKELKAVADTRFTPLEVLEFRELFLAAGAGRVELGFHEVKELLQCIVPMGAKNVEELRLKYNEIAARQMGVDGGEEELDFPEFLWLMRELLDINFAKMSDRATAMVEDRGRRGEKDAGGAG